LQGILLSYLGRGKEGGVRQSSHVFREEGGYLQTPLEKGAIICKNTEYNVRTVLDRKNLLHVVMGRRKKETRVSKNISINKE